MFIPGINPRGQYFFSGAQTPDAAAFLATLNPPDWRDFSLVVCRERNEVDCPSWRPAGVAFSRRKSMGRRAVYYTVAAKAEAHRARRAVLKLRPEAVSRRKAENRRQYLKRKPIPTIPEAVKRQSLVPMSWTQWRSTYERFYHGEDMLFLDDIELGGADFKALADLPPYSSTLMSLETFNDTWGELSAAIHGYLVSRYVQELEGRTRRLNAVNVSDSDTREELWGQYYALLKRRQVFADALGTKSMLQYSPSELISMINMQWTSRLLVYAVADLEASRSGRTSNVPYQFLLSDCNFAALPFGLLNRPPSEPVLQKCVQPRDGSISTYGFLKVIDVFDDYPQLNGIVSVGRQLARSDVGALRDDEVVVDYFGTAKAFSA
ncbi:hypothetical protein DFP72DRAFT_845524 [Ephemerocybe angulata]|uniref:Uncharacterized protein n=1 Tax=Ephemerocybe angulata TaxID=980116 RepID=A0A8H6I3D2_9AGAR|nr:hypothetical protein DFP72DRAFT_845524 [Tulosesus angulatus]